MINRVLIYIYRSLHHSNEKWVGVCKMIFKYIFFLVLNILLIFCHISHDLSYILLNIDAYENPIFSLSKIKFRVSGVKDNENSNKRKSLI